MRRLEEHEIPAAVEILAEASVNDPYWAYLIPGSTTRFHVMRKFLGVNLQVEWTRGKLMGIGQPLEGIAVWNPPQYPSTSLISRVKASLKYLTLISWTTLLLFRRMLGVLRRYRAMRIRYARHPFYHLILVGVRLSSQGKGYASTLIRPILDIADQEEAGAYVETTNPDNVAFYEHFGFEMKGEFSIPNSSLTGYGLFREAK